MLPPKILLILGAGASSPYGFPTASELRSLILGDYTTDVTRFLPQMGFPLSIGDYNNWILDTLAPQFGVSAIEDFRRRFRLSQVFSVDRFLAEPANEDHRKLGKAFIAAILLRCEREETLLGNWYATIFNYLIDTNRFTGGPYFSFITFNYDRSLEHFIYQSYLGLHNDKEAAISLVEEVPIIHVYGRLGSTFKMPPQLGVPKISYGEHSEVMKAADCIQLVRVNRPSTQITGIRDLIARAERIIFIGFGFDEMNLDAMEITGDPGPGKNIFASRYGLATRRQTSAQGKIVRSIKWGNAAHTVEEFLHESEALC